MFELTLKNAVDKCSQRRLIVIKALKQGLMCSLQKSSSWKSGENATLMGGAEGRAADGTMLEGEDGTLIQHPSGTQGQQCHLIVISPFELFFFLRDKS